MRIALFVAVLVAHISVHAFQCLEVFKPSRLTESQFFWLSEANKTDYTVTTMQSQSGQTVVLLGEVHVKNIMSSVIGKKVLLEFPYRAHESADSGKTWGGEWFSMYISSAVKEIQRATYRTEGSTIRDAALPKHQIIDSLHEMLRFLEAQTGIKLDDYKHKQKTPEPKLEYKNFFLENNHKPDLKENLYSVVVPTVGMAKTLFVPVVLASFIFPNSFVAEAVLPSLATIIGARALHLYAGKKLKSKHSGKAWYNTIFFDNVALVDARDKTMSKNINKILEQNPDVETLLVVVGQLHIEGLMKNLKSMGFE